MEDLDTLACKLLAGGGCFTAGTLVQTSAGPKPIERVQAGNLVWAYNAASGQWEFDPVDAAYSKQYDGELVSIRVGGDTIQMTADHPVYVVGGADLSSRPEAVDTAADEPGTTSGGRWVYAQDLRPGDVLRAESGGTAVIEAVSTTVEQTTVYSLTVENAHTFAVGTEGVLVHNGCTQAQFDAIKKNWKQWFEVVEEQENGQTVFRVGTRRVTNARRAFASGGSITVKLLDELDAAGNPAEVTVPFNSDGFPDFRNFLWDPANGGKSTVTLRRYTGSRAQDFEEANRLAGFAETPEGYTWHHTEKLGEMQLVRRDVHSAVRHTGGVAIYKAGMEKIYRDMGEPVPPIYVD